VVCRQDASTPHLDEKPLPFTPEIERTPRWSAKSAFYGAGRVEIPALGRHLSDKADRHLESVPLALRPSVKPPAYDRDRDRNRDRDARSRVSTLPSYCAAPSTINSCDSLASMQSATALLQNKVKVEDRNSIALRRALERVGVATKELPRGDDTPLMASGALKKPRERWTPAKQFLLFSVSVVRAARRCAS
jgi:hypothetical protein